MPAAGRGDGANSLGQLSVLGCEGDEFVVAALAVLDVHVEREHAGGSEPQADADHFVGAQLAPLTDGRVDAADFAEQLSHLAGIATGVAEPAAPSSGRFTMCCLSGSQRSATGNDGTPRSV